MEKTYFRKLCVLFLLIGIILSYASLFFEPRTLILIISFLFGLLGILGLLDSTRPGYNPPL
ncbi:hypothetical protein C9439_07390 [archaeon SCG-AAA382B04]|nr:hypothetical protein C9439_07390 [archaeon SCG-AAA382B04]